MLRNQLPKEKEIKSSKKSVQLPNKDKEILMGEGQVTFNGRIIKQITENKEMLNESEKFIQNLDNNNPT